LWRALRQVTREGYWSQSYWGWLCQGSEEVTNGRRRFAQMAFA
jgi:hypothetical protein